MPKKVFELANEVGMAALELVEKLKAAGLNVRNHMATLSDEELQKAMSVIKPAEVETQTTVKKKVVKKKIVETKDESVTTAGPVLASESNPVSSVSSETSEAGLKKKIVTVKRKMAKSDDANSTDESSYHDESADSHVKEEVRHVEAPVYTSSPNVYHAAPRSETRKEEKRADEVYREKVHTFTPIFVPEKEVIVEQELKASKDNDNEYKEAKMHSFTKVRDAEEVVAPVDPNSAAKSALDEEEDKKGKKRLGDLAAMVSKKGVAKVKDITTMRADEELKYATTIVGKGVFTPAAKKRIFTGIGRQTVITEVKESKRVIHLNGGCTATELAQKLSVRFDQLANKALEANLLVKKDDYLGLGLSTELAALYEYRVDNVAFDETKVIAQAQEKAEKSSDLPLRNPIITIMGHVDHGKTTLIDYIRKTKVAEGEAGGITQHIGAYSVQVKGHTLTFLDTPGHAAFASMRQRGADVTDIVVLVVAADDGVMPQTKESIRFCQNSNKTIIVAVNKMDKPGANPDRIKQELMEFALTPEDWGGDTQYVHISALTGDGVDGLLEAIQIQSEMMDLRETPKGVATGVVIESKIEQGRGVVATILVQKGTLNKGDAIVVGETYGRARSLMDYSGKMVQTAGPSTPVQVLGLEGVGNPGDILNVLPNEREAKKVAENRINERKALESSPVTKVASLEDFFASAASQGGEKKILKLIVRADVHGSYEAIRKAIEVMGNDEVGVEVLGGGIGAITENDVLMADSAGGYILGFNMRPVTSARRLAEERGVDIKNYSIIYELINDIKMALEGMLDPEVVEQYIGRAEVRDIFNVPKIGAIAGCSVVDGRIERGCNIRLLRDGKIIHDGKLSSLKRFKDDVKEVKQGYECGTSIENYNDLKVGDLIEAYTMEQKKRKLEMTEATL